MVHPNNGLCWQRNCQSFYYSPERWRDTTCNKTATLPLHTLIVSLTQSQILFKMLQHNTIPYTTILQCFSFIGEIPWENTMVNPMRWVQKNVGQQYHGSTIPWVLNPLFRGASSNPKVGERVYSKAGVQTQLNNFSGSGRLGSITNNLPLGDWS